MSELSSFLSMGPAELGPRIEEMVREHLALWHGAAALAPPPRRTYARREKRAAERELSALVAALSSPQTRAEFLDGAPDAARLEALASSLRPGFRRLLALVDLPLEAVYDARFIDTTRRFLQAARDFDPDLPLAAAYQALRNVWIMNSLQFDLGLPVGHDDAVFAYSMIYPYLDNVLDDAAMPENDKLGFVGRLRERLEGAGPASASPAEERLAALVRLIERRFPRPAFPGVYRALLAIYNAQVRSLLQQRPGRAAPAGDVLALSLEKGGASVLADGYLVAGALGPADEDFCFGFGTVLQLADDLQDLAEDARQGQRTLFSAAAGEGRPDDLVLRLESYLEAVLDRARRGASPSRRALCDAIGGGLALMFRESVVKRPRGFSRSFVRRARRSFPVRFSYLKKLRRKLGGTLPPGCDRLSDLDPGLVALMAVSTRAFSLD